MTVFFYKRTGVPRKGEWFKQRNGSFIRSEINIIDRGITWKIYRKIDLWNTGSA